MKLVLLLPVIFICAATAGASVTEQLLEELKTELKTEARAPRGKNDERSQQPLFRVQEFQLQLQRASASEEGDATLLQTVEALGAATLSKKIEGICKKLSAELRSAQEQREKSRIDEMEKAYSEALRSALAGKTAKDIDPSIEAVGKLNLKGNYDRNQSMRLQATVARGGILLHYLHDWQDYLAAMDAGNLVDARRELESLISPGSEMSGFMPRSEFLARMNELKKTIAPAGEKAVPMSEPKYVEKVRALITAIKTLDEIPATLAQLDALQSGIIDSSSRTSMSLSTTISDLHSISQSHEDIKRGFATRIGLASLHSGIKASSRDEGEMLSPLRYQLLLFAIPQTLGLPQSESFKQDENPGTYLQRILELAKTKEDWNLAGRVLEVAQTLNLGTVASTNDSTALRSFLAGVNQERAGQYSPAVISYQAALKSGSQFISPELIGTHLAAIKKASPAEFEKGMELTLNPPLAPPDGRYPYDPRLRGYPPGYPYPGQPAATPAPAPVLNVPAKATLPVTTPDPVAK